MKKIISLLCAALLLLSLSGAASADSTEIRVFDSNMMEEGLYEGVWVGLNHLFQVYVPADFIDVDLTTGEWDDSIFYVCCDESGTYYMTVQYKTAEELGGEPEYSDLLAGLNDNGYDAEFIQLNDLYAVTYYDSENDAQIVMILTDVYELYTIVFFPAMDETYQSVARNMLFSLMLHT